MESRWMVAERGRGIVKTGVFTDERGKELFYRTVQMLAADKPRFLLGGRVFMV
jgi:hypothetical protein